MKQRTRLAITSQEAGFTLMEIMVVVAILALIIGAVAVNVNGAQVNAKISVTKMALSSLDSALERFRLDFNAYPSAQNTSTAPVTNRDDDWETISQALNATGLIGPHLLYTEALKTVLLAVIPHLSEGDLTDDQGSARLQQAFNGPYLKQRDGICRDGFNKSFVLVVDAASGTYRLYSKGKDGKDANDGSPLFDTDNLISEGSQFQGPTP